MTSSREWVEEDLLERMGLTSASTTCRTFTSSFSRTCGARVDAILMCSQRSRAALGSVSMSAWLLFTPKIESISNS